MDVSLLAKRKRSHQSKQVLSAPPSVARLLESRVSLATMALGLNFSSDIHICGFDLRFPSV